MNILIAPDKFKGSLSAQAVCTAIQRGLEAGAPMLNIKQLPLADGGDGTLAILEEKLELTRVEVPTVDPLGRHMSGSYLIGKEAAFIEVATASGLVLLNEQERDPLQTSTYGTGLLLADALRRNVKQVYLLLGGSATHDVGTGIAEALGIVFKDVNAMPLPPGGQQLGTISQIEYPAERPWENIKLTMLCDVDNPLVGPTGAARVYAAQKGASPAVIATLEAGTTRFSQLLAAAGHPNIRILPGGGAAGGIGAGLTALLGGQLTSGFQTISELTNLPAAIQWADLVITGEGQLDGQSLQGKVVGGVLALCQAYHKDCALVVGKNALPEGLMLPQAITSVQEVVALAASVEDAMGRAGEYVERLARSLL